MSNTVMPSGTARPGCMIVLLSALAGCGTAEYTTVRGKVTLDGRPLAGANVCFIPEGEAGRPSFGKTDDQGNYVLRESLRREGAAVGKYLVRITTFDPGLPDVEPPVPSVPEKVPVRYNLASTLRREVKAGQVNVLDFSLQSTGQIVQLQDDF